MTVQSLDEVGARDTTVMSSEQVKMVALVPVFTNTLVVPFLLGNSQNSLPTATQSSETPDDASRSPLVSVNNLKSLSPSFYVK